MLFEPTGFLNPKPFPLKLIDSSTASSAVISPIDVLVSIKWPKLRSATNGVFSSVIICSGLVLVSSKTIVPTLLMAGFTLSLTIEGLYLSLGSLFEVELAKAKDVARLITRFPLSEPLLLLS